MSKVLVTGGTGFIAGVHRAAARCGSRSGQHGAVDGEGTHGTDAVAAQSGSVDRLRFVVADLMVDEGWDAALAGCDYVLHVASPLGADANDSESLIRPAQEGTLRVLAAASRGGRLPGGHDFVVRGTPDPSQLTGTVDETGWTNADEPGLAPYRRSKVLAERAAWDFVARQPTPMELTTVLPASASVCAVRLR